MYEMYQQKKSGSDIMPEISVIMLTFNREKLIGRAVTSILNQTFPDFEFIIVDNGSSDGSGQIADKFAESDSRIKVIHTPRKNIGSGRNTGLSLASGKYIAFIDDDDYAEPDMLQFLYSLAENSKADIAVCGSNKEENGKIEPNGAYAYPELYVMNAEQATAAYLRRIRYNAAMPTKLIKRSLFNKIRFSADGCYDDISTTYRCFANAEIVAAQGIPKYTFYRHSGNNSSAATKHNLLNPAQLYEYLNAFRQRTEYISAVLPQLAELSLYSEWSYMISMVEKINRYQLTSCQEPLNFMKKELFQHRKEFLGSPYITDFEIQWMRRYVLSGEKSNGQF